MSISTGPGRPVRAMWNASWIVRGISVGCWIMKECLTIGMVMPNVSASWKPSVPSSSVRTWPVKKTTGTRVHHRVGQRGDDVRRAGAGGGEADADLARRLRVALGRVAAARLVADEHVLDARVVQRVVGRQVGAARVAEYDVHALGLEAVHDGVDGSHAAEFYAPFGTLPRHITS